MLDPAKAAMLPEYADWLTAARNGDQEVREALARADRWCADKFREWYGTKDDEQTHFAHTLTAARCGDAVAEGGLLTMVKDRRLPAIVRATGLYELSQYNSPAVLDASYELLNDFDPQVRSVAIANLQSWPDESLVRSVVPLLKDPVRSVRTEAARVLARVPASLLKGTQRQSLTQALDEFKTGLLANSDRASAHLTLGLLYEAQQNFDAARQAYETAIHVEPQVTGPRTNLAALLDRLAERVEYHAAGSRVSVLATEYREKAAQLRQEELALLQRDVGLMPTSAPLQYRYGLLLYLHGRMEEAEQHLAKACALEPNSPDFALALTLLYQKQQRSDKALEWAKRLVALRPDDATYRQLLQELQRG